jgi:aspartyl/asparaginyl-tRNA synthetase
VRGAENSNTSRQLAEFWMIEPEIPFADRTDGAQFGAINGSLGKYLR